MAPIQRGQYIERNDKILRTIKKRNNQKLCLKATVSCISKVFEHIVGIKSKFFVLRDKFVGNWNMFADTATRRQCNVGADDSSLNETYNSLVEYCRSMDSVNNISENSYIETEQICSARYYASHLWSWNRYANLNSTKFNYLRKFVAMTLYKMSNEDTEFLLNIITYYYKTHFSTINCHTERATLINEILDKLQECTGIIIEIIHIWFMAMPLLKHLSYYIGWATLRRFNAFLLDENKLFSLLLLLLHKCKKDE